MSEQRDTIWTILSMLEWITGYFEKQEMERARYEAEVLLQHALGMQRIMIYANFDRVLQPEELQVIRGIVKRRGKHEPMAYIAGTRGFWNIDLKVDPRALIPRPDTETLVEAALSKLPRNARVVDLGTGSGAIALALAHDLEQAEIAAVDVSASALSLARENADTLGLSERVSFFEGDLFAALPTQWCEGLDGVVSNPPYIGQHERDIMGKGVMEFEPHVALFADDDGLALIKRLIPESFTALKPGGWLWCEIGFSQGSAVKALFESHGFAHVALLKDLGQKDRVVYGQRP